MAILKTCCCWCNVRSGSISCGVYTLILSLINGGLTGYNLFHGQSGINSAHHDHSALHNASGRGIEVAALRAAENWFMIILVLCVCLFGTSIILILGVIRDNRFFLLPWITVLALTIVLDTAALVYQCVIFGLLTFIIIQIIIWLSATLLNIYCLLCVLSQYQELKAGRGTRDYIRNNRSRVRYHSGIQQVHITQGPIYMQYPGQVLTSSTIQTGENGLPASVTTATTLIMAPPDYNTAIGSPPQYDAAISETSPLPTGNNPTVTDKNTRRKESSSPPPYWP